MKLHELAVRYRDLDAAGRARARAVLARPPDGTPGDRDAYSVPEHEPACSAHFCIHWVTSTADAPSLLDGDGDGVPNYVESVSDVFEHIYAREVGPPGSGGLAWTSPVGDGALGEPAGSGLLNRTDVYLKQLTGSAEDGHATTDPGQSGA